MTWNRSGRGGWSNLGPLIAMAMASAADEWEDEFKSSRHRRKSRDWQDGARRNKRRGRMFGTGELRLALLALISEALLRADLCANWQLHLDSSFAEHSRDGPFARSGHGLGP